MESGERPNRTYISLRDARNKRGLSDRQEEIFETYDRTAQQIMEWWQENPPQLSETTGEVLRGLITDARKWSNEVLTRSMREVQIEPDKIKLISVRAAAEQYLRRRGLLE